MSLLVIAEHDHQTLNTATLQTMTAARQMDTEIDIAVLGDNCQAVAEQAACIEGIRHVYLFDSPELTGQSAQALTPTLKALASTYHAVFCSASSFGKDVMPRVAAQLGVSMVSDIIAVSGKNHFLRPIYAGNALQEVVAKDSICCVTVRASAFDKTGSAGTPVEIQTQTAVATASDVMQVLQLEMPNRERPDLASATIVVSGGRGVGSSENFKLLEQLADKLGAALGASRAAVDAGFVSNDLQVGQTGKVVAPMLYIAVGISGAIQHLAGMKDSQVIVAINTDPDAPIFDVADYGLVGDLHKIVPELIAQL